MAIQKFLRMKVLIDGVTQVLLQNVTVNWDTAKQRVDVLKGMAGFTPGAKSVTISATSAVYQSGPEFDSFASGANDDVHEVQVPYGRKTIISEGWIQSGSIGQSTNASTETSFEFVGTYNPPK
jgi:hypothetical protein